MATVLLVTCGTAGDLLSFMRIGGNLKARGHDVALLTHGYYADVVRAAGLDFVALDRTEEFERFVEDIRLLDTQPGALEFFRRHVLPGVVAEYEKICARDRPGARVLIARSTPGIAARMAERLGIPLVSLLMAPIDVSTMRIIEDLIGSTLGAPINRIRGEVGLPPVWDWRAWWRMPRCNIAIWPEWFAAPHSSRPPELAPVGFVLDTAATHDIPPELRDMLDHGEPPILITHGTSLAKGSAFFTVSAEACRLLGRRGILVTRHKRLVPAALPDHIQWFSYLPFAAMLSSMGAIVHHGGIATIGQALAAGIPQLVLPDSSERIDNASYLERLGGGALLLPSRWRPDVVAEALRRLTNSLEIQERCRNLGRRINASDSVARACDVIEAIISGRHFLEPDALAAQATPGDASDSGKRADLMPDDLRVHVDHLSPERRALLALRLKVKTRAGMPRSEIVPGDEHPPEAAHEDGGPV